MITSKGQGALDGVYKLVAVRENGSWTPALKMSESPAKIPNPGHKRIWRAYDERGKATADVMSLDDEDLQNLDEFMIHHPSEHAVCRTLKKEELSAVEPLLEKVWEDGNQIQERKTLEGIRNQRIEDLSVLDPGVLRLTNPHIYHVSLTEQLWKIKQDLIQSYQA